MTIGRVEAPFCIKTTYLYIVRHHYLYVHNIDLDCPWVTHIRASKIEIRP